MSVVLTWLGGLEVGTCLGIGGDASLTLRLLFVGNVCLTAYSRHLDCTAEAIGTSFRRYGNALSFHPCFACFAR